ncbi:MAG: alpha/beta fold hydrolase [Chloroflexota bacterium]|nr:alpha/beta fold hydrolase [Chloroflexota bacterium]
MAYNEQASNENRPNAYLRVPVRDARTIPLPDGDKGEGLALRMDRGEIRAVVHRAPESRKGVIWVCGARGGFGGPGPGIYSQLAEEFTGLGITSLRMDYRLPNVLPECAMDLLTGVSHLEDIGHDPVVIVGHSFGGAVVIAAGAVSKHVAGVVSLSPQTYGANMAGLVSPRPTLVVHGKADTRLPYSCGMQVYEWAKEPKRLVLYDGAEHRLEECRTELAKLLREWIPETLNADPVEL